jgi:hypothetical protein
VSVAHSATATATATATGLAATLAMGASLGVAFNPLCSLVAAVAAGALYGSPRHASPARRAWMLAAVAAAWLVGDGFRVMGRLQDALGGSVLVRGAPAGATFVLLAVWAVVGLLLGYVLPAFVAVTVGHGVVRGTGWLSAIAVGASTSLAVTALMPYASGMLQALARGV